MFMFYFSVVLISFAYPFSLSPFFFIYQLRQVYSHYPFARTPDRKGFSQSG